MIRNEPIQKRSLIKYVMVGSELHYAHYPIDLRSYLTWHEQYRQPISGLLTLMQDMLIHRRRLSPKPNFNVTDLVEVMQASGLGEWSARDILNRFDSCTQAMVKDGSLTMPEQTQQQWHYYQKNVVNSLGWKHVTSSS